MRRSMMLLMIFIFICLGPAGCAVRTEVTITENGFPISDLLLKMGVNISVLDENGTVVHNDTYDETNGQAVHTWSLAPGNYKAIAESPGHSKVVMPFRAGLFNREVVLNFTEIIIASRVTINNEAPPPGIWEDVVVDVYAYDDLDCNNERKVYSTGINETGYFYAVIPPNEYLNPQVHVVIGEYQYLKPGLVDMYSRSQRLLYDFNMNIEL
ncbi:MAG TPA: hypothetical protein DCY85_06810 [Firmicutes bacterium]|jgi:hypothetical protein|nr:hypothetical protein [Bacillota bacterium]